MRDEKGRAARWVRILLTAGVVMLAAGGVGAADAPVPSPSARAERRVGETPIAAGGGKAIRAIKAQGDLGDSDFAVGVSFEADTTGMQDLGDLVSRWDAEQRQGFTLGLGNNTRVT